MNYHFTSHGLSFTVSGDGFVKNDARDDFEAIGEQVERVLDAMPAVEVSRLHAGAVETTDGPEAITLDDIAGKIKSDVTRTWHDPNGCMVSLIALPE